MQLFKKIRGKIYCAIALLVLFSTTLIGFIPIFVLGLLKLTPNQRVKNFCTKKVNRIVTLWNDANNLFLKISNPTHFEVNGVDSFSTDDWYLVIANHQSWLDIVILHRLFNRKIPVLKFFIKDQLKWMPLLGFCWWTMDCPFMKRYSPAYLKKNPHKKGKDLQSTEKALTSFKQTPSTLMSFIEGTRYSPEKKSLQNSPYQYLLKPKAGGISFVISTMGQKITHLLDVTITYPKGGNLLWNFLCHQLDLIKINIRKIPIPSQFLTPSLIEDETIKLEFREWLNEKWLEKDQLITTMKN